MAGRNFNRAAQRVKREILELVQNEEFSKSGISVETVNDNFLELKGEMLGPADTPYEGGKFILDIQVPSAYPFQPPKVRFVNKIWHPNISSVTGAICLNILKTDWAICIGLRTVLLSLQALLSAAEPDDPQDAVVAKQYKENPELFKLTARHWAQVYAGAPGSSHSEFEDKIKRLGNMGIDEEKALIALSSNFWDLTKTVDFIYR